MAMDKIMDYKQKGAIITAIISFICGWGLTIAGFTIDPKGEVSNSVLAILGEAMIYTASVFGVAMYFSSESRSLKREIKAYVDELKNVNENE